MTVQTQPNGTPQRSLPRATAAARIVAALQAHGSTVKQTGADKYQAQCPAHEDRNPSLAITGIKDSALVHCHAGCATDDVLARLSLGKADLFDNPRGASYEYRDANGRLTRTVYRSPAKQFRQDVIVKGVVPLYNLAAVMEAVRAGEPILVVEGEKDVHAAESQGATATTAPGGASNWAQADYGPLRGAKVHIIADRDEAGYKCAAGRRRHLLNELGVQRVDVVAAATGKDLSDHIAAGHGIDELVPVPIEDLEALAPAVADPHHGRKIILTPASDIKPRRTCWLWDGRLALGTLGLLAGRQGLGKSTLAYALAAQITRGTLPGEFFGIPRAVLVCATEDSWEHTIVPRLIAAGADLTKVHRVEVLTAEETHVGLSLPRDNHELEAAARETGAALLILDPIISRLGDLDTHRDSEVRQALEPLVAVAARTHMAVLGLIHHNKSGAADPVQAVMGSTAFSAVARSVHTVVPDPDDDSGKLRLFGTPKNNLGRSDLPTLAFSVESHAVDTEEGTAWTGRINWRGEHEGSIADAMRQARDNGEDRSAAKEAADWLGDFLLAEGPEVDSKIVKQKARAAGYSESTLHRAARKLGVVMRRVGFQEHTKWSLPQKSPVSSQLRHPPRGEEITEITDVTDTTGGQLVQSRQSRQSVHVREGLKQLEQDSSNGKGGRCPKHGTPTFKGMCGRCEAGV